MSTILAFGDVHLGHYRMPIEPYILSAMDEIAKIVEERMPDITIFAGDAFRSRTPSTGHMAAFAKMLKRIRDWTEFLLLVPGNHDKLAYGTTLDTFDVMSENIILAKEPGYFRAGDCCIVAVPWLPKRSLSSEVDGEINVRAAIEMVISFLKRDVGRSYVEKPYSSLILAAHAATLEGRLDTGGMSTLTDDVLWPRSFFEGFDLSILGHYHRPHEVYPNVFYTGSVCPLNFGEMGHKKSVLLFDTKDQSATHIILHTPNLYRINADKDIRAAANYGTVDLSEWEFEPDTFLQVVSSEGVSIINKPETVVWYEVVIRPPRKEHRVRLTTALEDITPEIAMRSFLEQSGRADRADDVIKLAHLLIEGDSDG